MNIVKMAKELQPEILSNRRYLHQNPEVGLKLPKTKEFVISKLVEYGYKVEACGEGLIVLCGKGEIDKTILLRADMDALPLEEKTDLPFASTNGNMHACGHDLHTAMLLGCAKILKSREDKIDGKIKMMFQPAEETIEGAKNMLESGVLKRPDVDAAFMLHVATGYNLPEDGIAVVLGEGAVTSSVDIFSIDIKGKGGHGAMPHETVDPINIAAHIYSSIQILNAREIPSNQNFVLSVGEFKGGTAYNIIPDTCKITGTIRTYDDATRSYIKKRLVSIVDNTAKAFNGEGTVTYPLEAPSVINDSALRNKVTEYLSEVMKDDVKDGRSYLGGAFSKLTGSEDFGYVSTEVPSIMIGLITGTHGSGFKFPPHHPQAVFNEEYLWKGTLAYAQVALGWINNQI